MSGGARRTLKEKTFYDLLDILPNAPPSEIRRAYKEARDLYAQESLASYSFFTTDDRRHLLEQIEKAYLILIDPGSRQKYDQELVSRGLLTEDQCSRDHLREPTPVYSLKRELNTLPGYHTLPQAHQERAGSEAVADFDEILRKEKISGPELRSIRLGKGIPLEHIALQTKIKISTLEAMEEEQYQMLPPSAYLKGFLRAYARSLQIDEEAVIAGYFRNMKENAS